MGRLSGPPAGRRDSAEGPDHLHRGRLRRLDHHPQLRGALRLEEALRRMRESRGWWRPDVYNAFMRTVRWVSVRRRDALNA